MAAETVSLTYRELAERLGISPDAARMKAKRAVKNGRWRIIPGNHPSDRVLVEIPAADIVAPERDGGEQSERVVRRTKGRTLDLNDNDTVAATLQTAQARITELTDQLTAEKDQHRDTAVELAKAQARVEALDAELARLGETADDLRQQLEAERRTWWQRLTGR